MHLHGVVLEMYLRTHLLSYFCTGLSCAGLDSHAEASGLTRYQGQRKHRAEKTRES